MKYFIASKLACRVMVMMAIIFLAAASAHAQRPVRHELIRGDMPPGLAADYYRMGNPALQNYIQPVRVIGPPKSQLSIAAQGDFVATNRSKVSVGMHIGPVYRFKVTNIPENPGKELYPSIEILNRLYPPEGLQNDFPIQVVMSKDDLKQAISGNLVTKVIYLENPQAAMPHKHVEDQQPYFDVGGSEDPLRASEKLGRPMAILRIGSRVPMRSDAMDQFDFHAPSPAILPDPKNAKLPPIRQGENASIPIRQK